MNRTHGKAGTPVYLAWIDMLRRCHNPQRKYYELYGGRGIKVCKRWHKFESFYADMGDPPAGMSIERNDNDGDYKPSNCRWATREEQNRNKSNCITGMYQGRKWCVAELARAHGIKPPTARERIKRGVEFVAACTTPAGEM